jgi:hypothetical protein
MPPRHVDDLFSGAYDDALTERQREWFAEHLAGCAECRHGFALFQSSIDSVRALPPARMSIPVHLPSTPPVAEERPLARLRSLRPFRIRPGMATGLAGAAAAVIVVVALTHQNSTSTHNSVAGAGSAAIPAQSTAPACPLSATATSDAVPAGFDQRTTATEPGRPGQQLVLATTSAQVRAGSQLDIYAVLTAPLPAAAAPAATVGKTASIAAVPCVTVTSALQSFAGAAAPSNNAPDASVHGPLASPNTALRSGSPPLLSYTVPAGTPKGTVLRVTATVPANYPVEGDPPMTVELTLTVN